MRHHPATRIVYKPFSPLLIPLQWLLLGLFLALIRSIPYIVVQPVLIFCWFAMDGFYRGFARFVNIRDKNGSTPLHLAARQKHAECVHILLDQGALVCASTGGSR